MEIRVVHKVMKANDEFAMMAREKLKKAGVLALNVLSAPGSGKTTLIERTIKALKHKVRIGVIEGDPDTARDAERIAPLGVPVVQINTDGGCHLDANLVNRVIDDFDLANLDLLFIENVGNLVCPAEFDLGESARVVVLSTPEGHDKPAKYAKAFKSADVLVLNKIDLLPFVDFDQSVLQKDLARLKPELPVVKVSCRTGEGLEQWMQWIEARLLQRK